MTHLSIRAASDDDVPFLREMIWEAISASPAFLREVGVDVVRRHEDDYWAAWPMRRDAAFVAIDGAGVSLGAIVLKPESPAPDLRGLRLGLGVRHDARRRGVARALLDHAIAFARSDGAAYLGLLVDPVNQAAIALYAATGFVLFGTRGSALEMRIDVTAA